MLNLYFYTTLGCHLCDDADAILTELTDDITIIKVDIADDAQLLAQYGTSIPVIKRADNEQELNWPFTLAILQRFIQ